MKISRQVGTQSQILNVYAQDFNVTTGAGIANIPASTVSYTWFRNNHAGASTGVGVSTASMGTYTSGAWTQINSATALGWYQFCIPNDALLSGDCAGVLLRVSTGAFTMAPIPIEIELTKTNNQQYMSSQTIGFVQNGVNVTSFSAAITTNANVIQAYGSAIVTSASGQFRVSTQAIDKGGYGVTTNADKGGYGVSSLAASSITLDTVDPSAWPLWGVIDLGQVGNIGTTSFTGSTAVLRAVSSSYSDDILTGASLFIYNVTTGTGQRRLVTDWASTNAVAQVDQWTITPTQTSAKYVLFALPPASSSNVPDVNVVKILSTTSPARPGYVGIDWAFVTSKAAYNDLSSTFISTNQAITGASAPTAAQNAAAVWGEINSSYTGVSTFGYLAKQITSVAAGVNVTAFSGTITTNANLLQVYGSAVVTSASGQLRVSTQAIDKGGYGVTTIASNITTNANLLQIYGTAAVTSAGGQLLVSTQALAGMSGSVNVTSINGSVPVTTAAGVLLVSTQSLAGIVVSTQTIPTFAVAGDAMALTAGERATLAGVILTTTQAESYRSVNATGSLMQLQYEILSNLTEQTASGTTRTLASVTSHTGNVAQYQYDSSSNPASITRIS